MKRREIVIEAKRLVAAYGPYCVLEDGLEMFAKYTLRDSEEWAHRDEIVAEARTQADRVLTFLGM